MKDKIKKLKIGCTTYDIKYKKNVIVNELNSYAAISHNLVKIEVCKDLNQQQINASLIHEAIHGILYNAGFYQSEHDERIFESIACGLIALLKDNPKLVKAITNK